MARVLTTAAGGDIGIGAIQALQKSEHETIAVDMDPHAAGIYIADYGTTVPPVTNEQWAVVMKQVVRDYDVDVVILLLDQELRELDYLQSELSDEIPVIVPRPELIQKTMDKKEMYEYFEQCGLRIPKTTVGNESPESDNLQLPKIAKPRYGQGSHGVETIYTRDEFQAYFEKFDVEPENVLIQELIEGPEYTSNITATNNNRLLSIVTKEVPKRDGYTALGITRDNPKVREACRNVFKKTDPAGPINAQHILDTDGTPHLIEINPRFSGSSCLTVEAGVNEFDLLVRDALGDSVEPVNEYKTDLSMIRHTNQIYIEEQKMQTCDHE